MTEVNIYIVLYWFWEGDSNLVGSYANCFAAHDEAKKHAHAMLKERDVLKIVDCDNTWNWWDEDGQYESPGIVQIIKKTLNYY